MHAQIAAVHPAVARLWPRRPRDRAAPGTDPRRDAQPSLGPSPAAWRARDAQLGRPGSALRPDRRDCSRRRGRRMRRLRKIAHDAGDDVGLRLTLSVELRRGVALDLVASVSPFTSSSSGRPLRRLTVGDRDIDPMLADGGRSVYFVRVPTKGLPGAAGPDPSDGRHRDAPDDRRISGWPGRGQPGRRKLAYTGTRPGTCRLTMPNCVAGAAQPADRPGAPDPLPRLGQWRGRPATARSRSSRRTRRTAGA